MFGKKLYTAAFSLSLFFGGLAALLSALSVYNRLLMVLGLFFGFLGFGLCCLHIVIGQREDQDDVKLSSTPMLLLSLFLNSTPLLCMIMLIWIVKHGS